ncbi:MAG: hypothetical protein HY907_06950 [Deltaproteobacteria bacterium]|nr:hypothetical protein [Deltaproteobacteria bacterium]
MRRWCTAGRPDDRRTPSAPVTPRSGGAAAVVLVAVIAELGCATLDAQFRADGFHDAVWHFHVTYVDPSAYGLMGADWRLDNFVFNPDGSPRAEKTGETYWTTVEFDPDGDGVYDASREIRLYDLRFEHRRDGGVVWLRTFPVADRLAEKELRLLAHDYVEEVAGGNYFSVRFAGREAVADVRFATTIVDQAQIAVDSQAAYQVTFDVANVDQLRLDPESRTARVRIVILRPPYSYPYQGATFAYYTTLMVIGYANDPEYFDLHVDEFEDFMRRLHLVPPGTRTPPR